MKETELWELLVSLSENEISLSEAHDQILCLFSVVRQSEQLCEHPRSERSYIGQNKLRCNKCGKEFS